MRQIRAGDLRQEGPLHRVQDGAGDEDEDLRVPGLSHGDRGRHPGDSVQAVPDGTGEVREVDTLYGAEAGDVRADRPLCTLRGQDGPLHGHVLCSQGRVQTDSGQGLSARLLLPVSAQRSTGIPEAIVETKSLWEIPSEDWPPAVCNFSRRRRLRAAWTFWPRVLNSRG